MEIVQRRRIVMYRSNIRVVKRGASGGAGPVVAPIVLLSAAEKLQLKLDGIMLTSRSRFEIPFLAWNNQTSNRSALLAALTVMLRPVIYRPKEWDDGLVKLELEKGSKRSGLGLQESWVGTTKFSTYVLYHKKETLVEGSFDYAPDRINQLPSKISYSVTRLEAVIPGARAKSAAANLPSRAMSDAECAGWKKLRSEIVVAITGVNVPTYYYYKKDTTAALADFLGTNYFGTDGRELRFSMFRDETADSTRDAATGISRTRLSFFIEVSRVYNAKTHSQRGEFRVTRISTPSGGYQQTHQSIVEWIPE
jgi:hypothetical protein